MGTVRQTWVADPAPSKLGAIDMVGGSLNTSDTGGQLAPVTSDTLSGSDILVFAVCSIDSFYAVSTISDSVNGTYTHIATVNDATTTNQNGQSWHFPNAAALKATAASFTASIAAKVLTVTGSPTGTLRVGQVVSGTSVPANVRIVSLGTGTGGAGTYNLNQPGNVTVGSESMTTADAISVIYNSISSGSPDYNGILAVEVTGASISTAAQGIASTTTTAGAGTGNASIGTHAYGSSPGLLLGILYNGTATASPFAPGANTGAGFTDGNHWWTWDLGQTDMRFEYIQLSNPGTTGATFNANGAEGYAGMTVFLTDAVTTFPPVPQAPWNTSQVNTLLVQ
jgi:hypothetical protein